MRLITAFLISLLALVGCVTTVATPTPDIPATVASAVEAALPTATPTPTPDIEATVEAQLQATIAAIPTPNPTATRTPTPPAPTPTLTPTLQPTAAPTPTPALTLASMVELVRPGVVRIDTNLGSGSGVIFESDAINRSALVLTNFHVIEDASWVDVVVNDSATYPGTVRGVDSIRDLAVISICCARFTALQFGDAERLRAGSEAVAIGYPLGIPGSATVTRGIVSAIRYDSSKSRWVIQVDAPINPGNSGGPLFSLDGKVVGINTYKLESAGEGRPAEGLGFAVSESTVQPLLAALKVGTYAAAPTPTPKQASRWIVYRNPTFGYSLDVAPGWVVEEEGRLVVYLSEPMGFATLAVFVDEWDGSLNGLVDDIIDFRREESAHLFELDRVYNIKLSSGVEAVRIDYRSQDSPAYCVDDVADIVVLVGSISYELLANICEHSLVEHQSAVDAMMDSFTP